ncbi:MAG TPA: hypothetical protein VHV58_06875 [Pseudolabrys sp.]|nr:hypothetical protein [Pseudolabrys sp.]
MAKTPQKSKDATDEALSAIQEALNIRDTDPQPNSRVAAAVAATIDPHNIVPPVTADLFHDDPQTWVNEQTTQPRRAANDDRESIGLILQTLRGRPKRLPYVVATAAAAFWAAAGISIAFLYRAELGALFDHPATGLAAVVGVAAAILFPAIFCFAIAHMIRRSQDLRLVAESMAEVAMRLAQPETTARESVVSVGQAVRREVAAMGDGVERALARATELEALVHNEVSALERAYNDNEVRIRELLTELGNQRETLVGQAEHVRNAISSVHLDLSHDITSVGDLVADKVGEVAQRVTRSLTEKGEHITLALGHAGDSMIDALSERGSNLLERLETTSDSATSAIGSASERLSASLSFKTDHVHDEFAELAARLQQMMTVRLDQVTQGFAHKSAAVIDQMATRSQAFTDAVADTGTHVAGTIAARADEVNSTLRSTGDSLVLDLSLRGGDVVSKMEQTGARITDAIVSRSNKVADTFRDSADTLVTSLNSRSDSIKDMLAARLQSFEEMFNNGGTELSEKVSREAATLGSLITRNISEFDRTVKTYGGELVERLGQRTEDVSESMRNYVDSFDQRVTARSEEISGALSNRLVQFEEILDTRVTSLTNTLADGGKDVVTALDKRITEVAGIINLRGAEVADSIGTKIGEIDQTLGTRALEVANNLDSRIGRFEELLVGRAETVTEQIETRTKAAADALHARMEQLNQSIKVNSSEAERSLGQLALSTTDAIRTSAGEVERTLLGVSSEVARSFVGKADEIANTVSARANEMTAILSDQSGGVIAALTEKGQQFATEVTAATELAVKSIEDRSNIFTRSMMDNSAEIARMINTAGESASNAVNRTLNELQTGAQGAIDVSKQTTTAAVTEMLETHNMVRSDTTALFERLREANIMLQEVLSGAHENMGALENTLMTRVSDFVSTMNDVNTATNAASNLVEQNIAGFRETTARVITDLGQLAVQFDAHGRELALAANAIDTSNQRTEDALGERRVTLDSLVATLDIRTEDLDQRLKRFSGLLDESLEAASTRARDIARVVSETSAEGTRAINEQYERVRESGEDERRRTAESMRAIFDQSSSDTHTIFREANDRFAETVHGMKQMAGEMQRELDATRAELRRGIFDLPQETAESAAQMRRVIVDQIEALAELNRIVARHGRSLDATEPMRRREEPTLAIVGGRGETRVRQEAPRPRNDATTFAPAPRRSEAPSLSPAQQGPGRGWLTDLLQRASREEGEAPPEPPREPLRPPEDRSPRHSIESLDSLSVDIARMIDHDAAADLWDRYKRGERNVFTRRLYTLQGQKAFDEIRKKYRGDREFKQTVDRYIGEFERLLDEVSRDDRGQVVARTYLTSETGKVYTMLAHAAGRFD